MILWNVLQLLATWDNELCGLQTSVQRLFEDGYCCTCKALLWGTRATSGWINEVGCLQSSSFLLHTHCTFETILNFDWLMGRKYMYIYCIFLKQCWNLTAWWAEKYFDCIPLFICNSLQVINNTTCSKCAMHCTTPVAMPLYIWPCCLSASWDPLPHYQTTYSTIGNNRECSKIICRQVCTHLYTHTESSKISRPLCTWLENFPTLTDISVYIVHIYM